MNFVKLVLQSRDKLHPVLNMSIPVYMPPYIYLGEGNGNPLQHSCMGFSREWLSDFHFHASEKEMATHSSVLARRIPGKGEPCGLLSMGSHRVVHDWSNLATHCLQKHFQLPPCGTKGPSWSGELPSVTQGPWDALLHSHFPLLKNFQKNNIKQKHLSTKITYVGCIGL